MNLFSNNWAEEKKLKSFIEKNKEYMLVVLFTYAVMILSIEHFPVPNSEHLSLWPMAHWGITYETGFVYRGLLGTIATGIFGKLSLNEIYGISLVLWLILGGVFSCINIAIYKHNKSFTSLVLILFVISQPSCVKWWGTPSMFGRIDIILVLVTCLVCVFALRFDMKLMLPTAFILSAFALLAHESFMVLFAPVIFALMLYKSNKGRQKLDLSPLYFYFIPISVLFVIVVLYGKTNIPIDDFKQVVSGNFTGEMSDYNFKIYDVFAASVGEKMAVAKASMDSILFVRLAMTFLLLLPELIFVGMLFVKYIKKAEHIKDKILVVIICGSCFAPLASFLVGFDFFRWVGYFIMCIFIVIVSMYLWDEKFREMVYETVSGNKLFVLALGIANISLGPFIALRSYPLVEDIVSFILAK